MQSDPGALQILSKRRIDSGIYNVILNNACKEIMMHLGSKDDENPKEKFLDYLFRTFSEFEELGGSILHEYFQVYFPKEFGDSDEILELKREFEDSFLVFTATQSTDDAKDFITRFKSFIEKLKELIQLNNEISKEILLMNIILTNFENYFLVSES